LVSEKFIYLCFARQDWGDVTTQRVDYLTNKIRRWNLAERSRGCFYTFSNYYIS